LALPTSPFKPVIAAKTGIQTPERSPGFPPLPSPGQALLGNDVRLDSERFCRELFKIGREQWRNEDMSIRIKLLSAVSVCALAFIVFGAISWDTLNTTKINGEYYHRITLGKDLIADVLPPPEYLVEAYLVIYQMLEEENWEKLQNLVEKSKSLREDYEKRHSALGNRVNWFVKSRQRPTSRLRE
jgi:hypothetical protein